MKIRIEVVDESVKMAEEVIEDLAWDIFNKYPGAEADLRGVSNSNSVEFLIKK